MLTLDHHQLYLKAAISVKLIWSVMTMTVGLTGSSFFYPQITWIFIDRVLARNNEDGNIRGYEDWKSRTGVDATGIIATSDLRNFRFSSGFAGKQAAE